MLFCARSEKFSCIGQWCKIETARRRGEYQGMRRISGVFPQSGRLVTRGSPKVGFGTMSMQKSGHAKQEQI